MRRRALLVPALSLALLTGCTGSSSPDSAAPAAAAGGVAAPAKAEVTTQAEVPLVARSLVRTADLTVQVPDVRAAAARAGVLVRGVGGGVLEEESGSGSADLRLGVPPARLDGTLERLAGLGRERDRQLSTDDVTQQVVDLDSRLATQRASVARVRALLDRATGLGDVVKVEGELARREADLESLTARSRALAQQVDLAVLTLHLTEDDRATAVAAGTGFRGGLDAGWRAFTGSARVLAAVVGALLPFLPLLLVAGTVLRWRARRPRSA